MPISVLVADDHEALRDGVCYMLRHDPKGRFTVFDEMATNGKEAVALYQELHPDVLVMDVKMPRMGGVTASTEIMALNPQAAIVLFSAHDEPGSLTKALRAGCRGYVLKSAHAHDVMRAIEMVSEGAMYIDPALASELIATSRSGHDKLTSRETEVLRLLAQGYTSEQASAELYITPETVRTHVRNACRKLKADNKTHAVALALKQGLIELGS